MTTSLCTIPAQQIDNRARNGGRARAPHDAQLPGGVVVVVVADAVAVVDAVVAVNISIGISVSISI